MYRIEYTKEAYRKIKNLDKRIKERLKKGIEFLANNPMIGKRLTGPLVGRWSYRVGDYRIIYEIYPEKLVILVLSIGHRKEIYKKRKGNV
ncbi:MAG: type II toxin-antitoxin system RelE/ParE family toxin [bacterium]